MEFNVKVSSQAKYWLHRHLGNDGYTQYILPKDQVPKLNSGEIVGPLSRRAVKKFFIKLYKEKYKSEIMQKCA